MRKVDGEIILFWALPFFALMWIVIFFLFPGFSPPMSPTMSAEQVAAFYRDPENLPRIRYSMIMFNWFAVGIVTFLTLIVMQMKRMAHRTPILAYCYLGCSTGGPVLFFLADLFWLMAAFRPERDPQLTQLFNDLAWVTFTGQVGFMVAQCVFLALAIFLDRQAKPIFQRWVAHFNLIIAAAVAPAAFVATALTGPLAWDGLLSFWVRNSAIALWLVVMAIVIGKTLYKQRAEEVAAA
ncbi:hypothetical protein [Stenotrophobium rhamnosiphilum]|uniref:DUF998 domain-containing protein n=1 Tax=Stenotrophobium rhamnosiphilum TaxID=2029166 RepID=A0A2T5MD10_9GAMM|nr:hypothetical protein [Stenotrophobium rhamnosiphilum]PTU30463.1 hypothetical protein CJD38_13155 [Stenotrophobium rhamnosiphilum]